MRRFLKVYMTILVISLVAVNLVLVLLYGSRFYLFASTENPATAESITMALIVVNLAVVLLFTGLWFVARHFYRQSRPKDFL